jgi:alcohol dehydrogenase class IV
MARPLGGQFDVPHGVANAIILPWALRFNLGVIPERARRIAEAMGLHVDGLSKDKLVETIFEALEGLIANVGIPRRLSELGVPHGAIKDLARVAASVERIKYVNPRPITLEDIERLYEEAMSGEK